MDYRIYRLPLINVIFRHMGAIPIAPAKDDPALMEAAFEEVAKALANSELVGIFPEGRITTTGRLMKIYAGVALVAAKTQAQIFPVILLGPEFSKFSRMKGKLRTRWLPKVHGICPAWSMPSPHRKTAQNLQSVRPTVHSDSLFLLRRISSQYRNVLQGK